MNDTLKSDIDREVEMCSNLRNPFIVTFLGRALQPGKYFLVMELVQLGSLGSHVKKGPLDPRFKIRILLDVARGMDLLHQIRFFSFLKKSQIERESHNSSWWKIKQTSFIEI
mgnify:CR=1 FL=1